MLPKKNRASREMLEEVFKKGKLLSSPGLTFRFIFTEVARPPRISFVAPKSVSKKSVTRNALRRRGYNVLRKHISEIPAGLAGAFVFKKVIDSAAEVEKEIKTILAKL